MTTNTHVDNVLEQDAAAHGLSDDDWNLLLTRIEDGKCTPFIGAGACYDTLPLGADIAQEWAKTHEYPLGDCRDLASVAQFLAVKRDAMFPKEEILKRLDLPSVIPPNFQQSDEPHSALARLPLPVYMTTNYDDFLVKALEHHGKEPKRELCRWNTAVKNQPSAFSSHNGFNPDKQHPVVFHLHGTNEVSQSLVLTEDDYLDFLVNVSRNQPGNQTPLPPVATMPPYVVQDQLLAQGVLPPLIQRALTGSSLLFLGYSLKDWSFRVLFRGLFSAMESSLRYSSVTVQLPPPSYVDEVYLKNGDRISGKITSTNGGTIVIETEASDEVSIERRFVVNVVTIEDRYRAQDYLDRYFAKMEIRVFWGDAREFCRQLSDRWEEFQEVPK